MKRDGSLDELPILKCWPEDGGRFITLPLVFTKDPETGVRNIGTYRMQVFDGRTTGMHWQRHKGGAQHHRVAERLGKRLEVAVALSPEPVLTYCATAPMPEGPRRAAARRISRAAPHRDGQVRDGRSRGAGQRAHRARRLRRARRAAARRALRRSHGLLFAARRLPGVSPHVHHAAQTPDVSDDRRRHSADGGFLSRDGERADLPAAHPEDASRDRRHALSRPRASSTTSSSSRSTSAIRATRARS